MTKYWWPSGQLTHLPLFSIVSNAFSMLSLATITLSTGFSLGAFPRSRVILWNHYDELEVEGYSTQAYSGLAVMQRTTQLSLDIVGRALH